MDEQPNRANIFVKNSMKSSNESSSPLTTNTDSSDNNETITLTNSNSLSNNSPMYRGRRFFKSKSASVSRATSNTSRIINAEKIYIQNSSEELSTSETDDQSDEEDKLVYKTCMENPPTSFFLKKNQFNSIEKPETNRRYVKHNRLKLSKSMSNCKNQTAFQHGEEEENEDDEEEQNLHYNQLDGRMKQGKLSRFKVIKSKSNSALQTRCKFSYCFSKFLTFVLTSFFKSSK